MSVEGQAVRNLTVAIVTAAGLLLGWTVAVSWMTFTHEMRLGQYHLHGHDPRIAAGAWSADPQFNDCETRPIVLTHVWFTMATNQRRSTREHRDISAYGPIERTFRMALWGAFAASFALPVGLAAAGLLKGRGHRARP